MRYPDFRVPQYKVPGLSSDGQAALTRILQEIEAHQHASDGGCVYDALVDGTQVTDTAVSPPRFAGIGEACTYCASTLGLTSAVIAVRTHSSSYTEAANWTMPTNTTLIGIRGTTLSTAAAFPLSWSWSGYRPSNAAATINLRIENFTEIDFGSQASAGGVRQPFDSLWGKQTSFDLSGFPATSLSNTFYAEECVIDVNSSSFVNLATGLLHCNDTDLAYRVTGGTWVPVASTGRLILIDCRWEGPTSGGAVTCTLPLFSFIDITGIESLAPGGTNSLIFSLANGGDHHIHASQVGGPGSFRISASAAFTSLRAEGEFGSIQVSGAHTKLIVDAMSSGSGSTANIITGPANVNLELTGSGTVEFRGNAVRGNVSSVKTGADNLMAFVGADYCQIDVAALGSGASAGCRPYTFDANSNDNVLVFAGAGTFPSSGTDAGANNRVLPETGTSPGSAPGGELGGTWATPTVDATHSGSAHTDFIAKALGDAKGDIIGFSAADTPVRKAVGTDGQVLKADSAQSDGLRWAPVVDSPQTGWGSITNVSVDRAYDANATTLDELADVLGTLVADLIAKGFIAS